MDKKTISRKTKQPQDKSRGESEVQALRAQINDCHEEIERLRHLAGTDELTELANRRSFDRELKRRIAEFNRFGTQFSLIMLDIDNFKSVNDQYGHLVGDEFLKEFAKRLRGQIRESDLLARYGGDPPKGDQCPST